MMRARAAEGWARYRSKDNSPVVDLFFGMMRKMVTCHGCGNKTYRWEVFNVLSVPCKGASFIDWIRATEEQIEGFACDGCHGRHPATIHSALWSLPPNLFVTLQRFEPNGMKNMTACPYQGEPLRFEFAPESPNAQDTYELRGIVDHHGTHRGGHYTAQWKHPKSQEWWWYDDEKARPMPAPQPSTPSAYIMFFRKT
jgi:ubiquitin C-terminal hydrolase